MQFGALNKKEKLKNPCLYSKLGLKRKNSPHVHNEIKYPNLGYNI